MMYHELKDYMDDIVVKSRRQEDHVKVLRKVFKVPTFQAENEPTKTCFWSVC